MKCQAYFYQGLILVYVPFEIFVYLFTVSSISTTVLPVNTFDT